MKIGIIGVGRLGICVAITLANEGFDVIGMDKDKELIDSLNNGLYSTSEPGVLEGLIENTNIRFTNKLSDVLNDDVTLLMVYVATPSLPDGCFDHSSIEHIIDELKFAGTRDKKIAFVIGSSVMPGYCNSVLNVLKSLNYGLIYNPEFIAQGSIMKDLIHPDQVLIGEHDTELGDRLVCVYKRIIKSNATFNRMDLVSAEITKLATNCFLTTKISFANSIGDLTKSIGGNPEDVLSAIGSDSRIGSKYLNYGFGFGGPCFPRDNQAIISLSKQQKIPMHLAEATIRVNEDHLQFQLNEKLNEDLDVYHFDHVSYKPGTDILEESQQLKLAVELVKHGKKVKLKNASLLRPKLEEHYSGFFDFE
jgi:nucleotide sugar dehydrogenase